jgi:HK97 gp10 family phage protein
MSSVRVKVTSEKNFKSGALLKSKYDKKIKDIVATSANLVRNTAVSSIAQNPNHPSKAGDPPATDTGYLQSNIYVAIDADRMGASVESLADYSVHLEFGTTRMEARPFMQPALESNKPKIRRMIADIIR